MKEKKIYGSKLNKTGAENLEIWLASLLESGQRHEGVSCGGAHLQTQHSRGCVHRLVVDRGRWEMYFGKLLCGSQPS